MGFRIDFIRIFRTPYSEVYDIILIADKGEISVGTLHIHFKNEEKTIFLYLGSEYLDHFTIEQDDFKMELLSKIYEISEGNKGFSEFRIEFLDSKINPIKFTWDEVQQDEENNKFYGYGLVEGEKQE